MKKVKLLSLVLLLVVFLMGCTDREKLDDYQSINKPEVNAYKDFLSRQKKGFNVALIRLDEDDVYEMALLRKDTDKYIISIYEYKNEQVVEIDMAEHDFYDKPGRTFAYLEGQNCFYEEINMIDGDDSYMYKNIFSVSEGKVNLEKAISSVFTSYKSNNLKNLKYYIDGEEVTKSQFVEIDKTYELNNDQEIIPEGFFELRADYMVEVRSKKDLEKALSADYFSFYSTCYSENGRRRHIWGM